MKRPIATIAAVLALALAAYGGAHTAGTASAVCIPDAVTHVLS